MDGRLAEPMAIRRADPARGRPGPAAAALLLLALGGTLAACGTGQAPAQPAVQPSSRTLRVSGAIAPDLQLRVVTRWLSTAQGCRSAENLFRRLDGTTTPSSTWVEAEVLRAEGAYEARVALDQFAPGECGWRPFVIAFQVTNAEGVSTGHFEARPGGRRELVPGPQELVWIDSTPGGSAASGRAPQPRGARFVRPLDLVCAEQQIRGARGLSCVTESPREIALISLDAEAVEVNFSSGPARW